jgi:hypothetical protein
VVYLGNRWILTAHHVGASIVVFDGKRYNPVAGSLVSLRNSDETLADLLLFQIDEDPQLPPLRIATSSAKVGEQVVLIAAGSSRGERVTLQSETGDLMDGFLWNEDKTKRWGTNRVEARPQFVENLDTTTMAFPVLFDRIEDVSGTRQEASAARGDSGGALFSRGAPFEPQEDWVLSGILVSVSARTGHPARSTFYGDITWVADLSYYRDEIVRHVGFETDPIEDPEPASGSETTASGSERARWIAALTLLLVVGALAWRGLKTRSARDHTDR